MSKSDDTRSGPRVVDLSAAGAALDRLPPVARVRASMELASFFLEYAAYEMALDHSTEEVSEIILMAARLDQASQRLDESSIMRASAHNMRKI